MYVSVCVKGRVPYMVYVCLCTWCLCLCTQSRVPYKWLSPEALLAVGSVQQQERRVYMVRVCLRVCTGPRSLHGACLRVCTGPGPLQVAEPRGLAVGSVQQQERRLVLRRPAVGGGHLRGDPLLRHPPGPHRGHAPDPLPPAPAARLPRQAVSPPPGGLAVL